MVYAVVAGAQIIDSTETQLTLCIICPMLDIMVVNGVIQSSDVNKMTKMILDFTYDIGKVNDTLVIMDLPHINYDTSDLHYNYENGTRIANGMCIVYAHTEERNNFNGVLSALCKAATACVNDNINNVAQYRVILFDGNEPKCYTDIHPEYLKELYEYIEDNNYPVIYANLVDIMMSMVPMT